MEKEEFIKRRVDDFNVVDNTLRDMADISDEDIKVCITNVICHLYDLFNMPHNNYDEKVLDEIRKRFEKREAPSYYQGI